jgi:hypothetical protein
MHSQLWKIHYFKAIWERWHTNITIEQKYDKETPWKEKKKKSDLPDPQIIKVLHFRQGDPVVSSKRHFDEINAT